MDPEGTEIKHHIWLKKSPFIMLALCLRLFLFYYDKYQQNAAKCNFYYKHQAASSIRSTPKHQHLALDYQL